MDVSYFFDTYALVAIFEGKESYRKFSKEDIGIITTVLNLTEFKYVTLASGEGMEAVEKFCKSLIDYCTPISFELLNKAAIFRVKHRHFSYIDCLGYLIAKENDVPFLTGDDGFREFENIEFVK